MERTPAQKEDHFIVENAVGRAKVINTSRSLDISDFESVFQDVEARYKEKGKKYADQWKHIDYDELCYRLCKDFQDLVDEHVKEKYYKRLVDVVVMSLIVATRTKNGIGQGEGNKL